MASCNRCLGSGKRTCISCNGKVFKQRRRVLYGEGFEIENYTCMVCAGKKKIKCDYCRGTGSDGKNVNADPKISDVVFPDVLEGKWYNNNGDYYAFEKVKENDYTVEEYGKIGRTGKGKASLKGNKVTIKIKRSFFINSTFEFSIDGNKMSGNIKTIGIKTFMVFGRR